MVIWNPLCPDAIPDAQMTKRGGYAEKLGICDNDLVTHGVSARAKEVFELSECLELINRETEWSRIST